MSEVKWIKITTDMFDNRKIKHLRRLPEGNNIVLIWVMLLTMAGRCNSGGMIFLTENIPYTPRMLANELNFEETTVQLALSALEELNMIVTDNGFFFIAGWNDYQNIEGMDKIREQNRIRKQRQREKERLLMLPENHVKSRDSHATDKEEEKEKEKEEEIKIYSAVVAYLNEKTGKHFKDTAADTRRKIHARLEDGFTLEDFKKVIDNQCAEWLKDKKMQKYLRPETLFGTKFEGYLNANTEGGADGGTDNGNSVNAENKIGTWL
mgnify:CR=1 FL=1